ncbi:hypothetical protein N7513_006871 [Penicillium frequentans]|nr:hypothetical protein N7513_006871 [Penicillium glabrum]
MDQSNVTMSILQSQLNAESRRFPGQRVGNRNIARNSNRDRHPPATAKPRARAIAPEAPVAPAPPTTTPAPKVRSAEQLQHRRDKRRRNEKARRLRKRDADELEKKRVEEEEGMRVEEEEEVPVDASGPLVDPLPSREERVVAMESETAQLRGVEELAVAAGAMQLIDEEKEAGPVEGQLLICSAPATEQQ